VPNLQLLDPRSHARLRLRTIEEHASHFVQIVAAEFAAAAVSSPILFSKEPDTGAFYAGAIFGFKAGENLLGTVEERGGFKPLILQREGFFLSDRHIAIDRDHTRFSEHEGELMFDEAAQPGTALRAIQRVLGDLHNGLAQTKTFIAALANLKLIEPIDISLNFDDGERLTLQGLYTVSLDRLRDLDDAAVLGLFRPGHLQFAYTMTASLKQIGRLARVRNRRVRKSTEPGS
jgi:hypothetical protein